MTQFHHTGTGREMGEDPRLSSIQESIELMRKMEIRHNPKGEHWLYKKHKADNPKETPFSKYAFCFIIGMLAGAAVLSIILIRLGLWNGLA